MQISTRGYSGIFPTLTGVVTRQYFFQERYPVLYGALSGVQSVGCHCHCLFFRYVELLTERLCLSAPLELCQADIYTQPVNTKTKQEYQYVVSTSYRLNTAHLTPNFTQK